MEVSQLVFHGKLPHSYLLQALRFFTRHFYSYKRLWGDYIVQGLSYFTLPRKMSHEVKERWRKLRICGLHDLYSLPNIIRVIKSRIMGWAGHIKCMRKRHQGFFFGGGDTLKKQTAWKT